METIENLMIEAAALKRLIDATPPGMPRLSGTGPARHRVRAVQFLWIRHATPEQLLSLLMTKVS